jgi:hypothetical protein
MDQNPFLKSFINMRKSLHTPKPEAKRETKSMPNPSGITMAYIIENKPPQKEVAEYFKLKCEALNTDT